MGACCCHAALAAAPTSSPSLEERTRECGLLRRSALVTQVMDGGYRKSPPHFGNPVTPVCERRPLKKVERTLVGWGWTGRGGWPPGRIKRGSGGSLPTGDQRALMSQMFVHALSITPPSSSDASKEDSVWVCWGGGP